MKKLLVIDDSFTVRKVVEMLLAPLGYDLTFAESAAKGRDLFASVRPEGLVIDCGLPDGDGVSLSAEFKGKQPSVPVLLMMSGKEQISDDILRRSLADDVIEKPFDSQGFVGKIDALKDKAGQVASPPRAEQAPAAVPPTPPSAAPSAPPQKGKEDFDFDFDLGEEFSVGGTEPPAPQAVAAKSEPPAAEKAFDLSEIGEIEEIEEIEEIAELEEFDGLELLDQSAPSAPPAAPVVSPPTAKESLMDEISLEELLEGDSIKEPVLKEPVLKVQTPVKTEGEEQKVNIEELFADLNDILAESSPKAAPAPEPRPAPPAPPKPAPAAPAEAAWAAEKVKPVVEQVARELLDLETVGRKTAAPAAPAEDLDIWDFETEAESEQPAAAAVAAPAAAMDRKSLERAVREVTYEVIEKIAWEVVPEIVDTVLKDKFGRK